MKPTRRLLFSVLLTRGAGAELKSAHFARRPAPPRRFLSPSLANTRLNLHPGRSHAVGYTLVLRRLELAFAIAVVCQRQCHSSSSPARKLSMSIGALRAAVVAPSRPLPPRSGGHRMVAA